jgi:hypothetical protein
METCRAGLHSLYIGVRLSTANPEISGSIHVWVQEFVEEVRL